VQQIVLAGWTLRSAVSLAVGLKRRLLSRRSWRDRPRAPDRPV